MSKSTPAIGTVKARAVVTPMARPLKNAFGVIDVAPLVLIDVATRRPVPVPEDYRRAIAAFEGDGVVVVPA